MFGSRSVPPLVPIVGGPGRDALVGTDASEAFRPGGGRDCVTTGDGNDTIYFDDLPCQRDVLMITDFDPLTDTLDLKGATVAQTFACARKTVLLLEGDDRDMIVLLGVTDNPFDFLA